MEIEQIKDLVRADQYQYTLHAEIERKADGLTFAQIELALFWNTIPIPVEAKAV